jgi:hypothetical protein
VVNPISNARFVIPMWPSIGLVAITTFIAGIMIGISRDSTVRTADAVCTVGEAFTTRDGIGFRLGCQEPTGTTSTTVGTPSVVLEIMRSHPKRITCNVMQSGWTDACRLGG